MAQTDGKLGLSYAAGAEVTSWNDVAENMRKIDSFATEIDGRAAEDAAELNAFKDAVLDTAEEIEATTVEGIPAGALGVNRLIMAVKKLITDKITEFTNQLNTTNTNLTDIEEKISSLNSKLLYEEVAFEDLIDTYSRVGLFSGFRLFKVGRTAHLQFGFYNKAALSTGHFFVKLPPAYRPISTVQLFDLSDDIKYRLDTDGVMRATKSIDVNTATRIITTYYCAE